ncbi:hypothetical protein AAFN47_19405 [Hoeflea sp. CAU 1731]
MPKRRHRHNPTVQAIACCAAIALFGCAVGDPALAKDLKNGKPPQNRGAGQAYEGSGAVGLPTRIPGIGTYAGALAGERFRGNGNYFYYQGAYGYIPAPPAGKANTQPPQGMKIIEVGKDTPNEDCDEASGVCIIRP